MIDRSHTEATLDRVAFAALTYYPSKPDLELGYRLDEDIAYCLAPLGGIDQAAMSELRELITDTIIDPTAHRERLVRHLEGLASA